MNIGNDMEYENIELDIKDFYLCGSIWNMERNANLARQFYEE